MCVCIDYEDSLSCVRGIIGIDQYVNWFVAQPITQLGAFTRSGINHLLPVINVVGNSIGYNVAV